MRLAGWVLAAAVICGASTVAQTGGTAPGNGAAFGTRNTRDRSLNAASPTGAQLQQAFICEAEVYTPPGSSGASLSLVSNVALQFSKRGPITRIPTRMKPSMSPSLSSMRAETISAGPALCHRHRPMATRLSPAKTAGSTSEQASMASPFATPSALGTSRCAASSHRMEATSSTTRHPPTCSEGRQVRTHPLVVCCNKLLHSPHKGAARKRASVKAQRGASSQSVFCRKRDFQSTSICKRQMRFQ